MAKGDAYDEVDGRFIDAVAEYASTCDCCSELALHTDMEMHEPTQLGLCGYCRSKGITISVFDDMPTLDTVMNNERGDADG